MEIEGFKTPTKLINMCTRSAVRIEGTLSSFFDIKGRTETG
jgi:hypothetical protein